MRYLIIFLSLVPLACARSHNAEPPTRASARECEILYAHNLAMVVDTQVDPDHLYNKSERLIAIHLLDQTLQERGSTQRFYLFCTNRMTSQQVACAMQSHTAVEGALCAMP